MATVRHLENTKFMISCHHKLTRINVNRVNDSGTRWARKTNKVSFFTNYGITNTLEWLFPCFGSSLAGNSKMAAVRHIEMTPFCPFSSLCANNLLFLVLWEGGGSRFEYRALEKLAVIFEKYMGANFSSKWFRLSNQSRKKVGKEWSRISKKWLLKYGAC